MTSEQSTVRIIDTITLSDNWYILKKYVVDYLRRDGTRQRLEREVYDRGNGAVILLYNRQKNSVILIRQFRLPVYVNGHDGFLIEAAAGLLEEQDPVSRIKAEAEEETGFRITDVEKVFEAFMSPDPSPKNFTFLLPNMKTITGRQPAAACRKRAKMWKCWKCRSRRLSPRSKAVK